MSASRLLTSLALAAMAVALPVRAAEPAAEITDEVRNQIPDTPGTGRFPALKETDPGLPGQAIFRPADLDKLGNTKLGIYAFGNGACTDDAGHTRLHLLEVASHGYLVIVPGSFYTGPGAIERPANLPRLTTLDTALTRPQQLEQAITWALKENQRPGSRYYGKIDPKAIAVSGFSCGGLQALAVAGDPRVKAVVVHNSGVLVEPSDVPGMDVGKQVLDTLHTPVIYIQGGEPDIAYSNGMDDFNRIRQVPVAMANLPVGHGGTFDEPNGGEAARVATNWLNWQLRGDAEAARMFTGPDCGLCKHERWTLQWRNEGALSRAP